MKKKRKSCQASHLKVTDIASLYGEVSFNQASSIFVFYDINVPLPSAL